MFRRQAAAARHSGLSVYCGGFCLVPYIRVEDLLVDDDPPQIHIIHAKRGADRYVLILPALADQLRTHLRGRQTLWAERLAS